MTLRSRNPLLGHSFRAASFGKSLISDYDKAGLLIVADSLLKVDGVQERTGAPLWSLPWRMRRR